jgi:arylsulfatase A-like enzyme
MILTDSHGEQRCTAERTAFITGRTVFRTGLSKVVAPGIDVGLQAEAPAIAELLKAQGYATGQFAKDHLGDLIRYLPAVHGFDEFFAAAREFIQRQHAAGRAGGWQSPYHDTMVDHDRHLGELLGLLAELGSAGH